jgi:hypothetical protein
VRAPSVAWGSSGLAVNWVRTVFILTADDGCTNHRPWFYSGSEAKAHPFTGGDEADNWESIHEAAQPRSFIVE